ncbi:trypsin-like serine protease [Arthrobacter sp. NPDC058130]|uniref:S1 family peptidase n=1 Tax=Arthrobacter sp. NPDC058130 TaxID=3346353 RepID=UPI0036E58BE9
MKTPKFQPMVRAAAALAIALAGTVSAGALSAVPALAEAGSGTPAPVPSGSTTAAPVPTDSSASSADSSPAESSAAPSSAPINDAGLAEAVQRDLGMTMAEFDAAGALARRAADAAPSLRALPGYVGIRLAGGKIAVEGSGPELLARVAELNGSGPADFVLAAPAAAAVVPSAAELLASSTQQLFEAYVREVGAAGLQAVTYANGHFVIRTGGTNTAQSVPAPVPAAGAEPSAGTDASLAAEPAAGHGAKAKMSAADFVARYANVALEQGSRIATEGDFFGGQGYIIDGRTLCSAGFGAFDPAGEPLVLTAGHCADDGAAKQARIEDPAGAPAASGAGSGTPGSGAAAGILGTFGFSQFGGPDNSTVAPDGTNVGTDIAVLKGIRSGVDLQPAITRWDNPADPGPTSVKIVGTVAPFQGQPVCRSGRTLGWSCGTVDSVGTWVIAGPNSLPPDYNNDLRALNGFDSSTVKSRPGDSGGPWISGNFAVGMHTGAESEGGVQTRAIATTLEDAIGRIPGGVQLQLFLNKPTLTKTANGTVTAGEPITGHVGAGSASVVAPNSKVRITVKSQKSGQKAAQPVDVPVDASGNWQIPAPSSAGHYTFSAETVNGFSRSGAVSLSVDVSVLTAPAITSPADGPALTAVDTIEGTGEAGRTVRLSGDFTGTGTIAADGRWSINVADQPVFGKVSVTAVLTAAGEADSPAVTRTFSVIPPAPAVSSPRDGKHLRQDALPASITGTAVDGAKLTVAVDGAAIGSAQAGSGESGLGAGARAALQPRIPRNLSGGARWSVPFPAGLATGAHTLTVTQAMDGVASLPATVAFTVDAAPVSAGTHDGTPNETPGQGPAPSQPTPGQPTAQQPGAQQPGAQQPGPPAAPADPAQAPVPPSDASVTVGGQSPGDAGQLASTGAAGLLPAAGLGAGALLLGAAFVAFGRRRARR